MERMIIKHLSGSKANQVEEFALKHHNELIFGRDEGSTVKYDPDRDDLVGRQHAKIQLDPSNPNGFTVTDLSSRNGTFVNNNKISSPTQIMAGDVIQFGPNGPKFQFDVEPRPSNATKATRIAPISNAPETRVTPSNAPNNAPINVPIGNPSVPTQVAAKSGVGKATVERMISATVEETKKQEGRKYATVGGAAAFIGILLIGSLAFGGYYYNSRMKDDITKQVEIKNAEIDAKTKDIETKNQEAQAKIEEATKNVSGGNAKSGKTAADVAEKNSKAVIQIEVGWKLIHPQSNAQAYHLFVPTQTVAKLGGKITTNSPAVPVYVKTENSYEPLLVEEKGQYNVAIGSVHSGTGFIVSADGFILTNRHVAATWKTSYQFNPNTPKGIVLSADLSQVLSTDADAPGNWVPANSKGQGGMLGKLNMRVKTASDYTGVNDKLEVALPGRDRRMNARLVESSDRHDVAVLKIDKMGDLPKVEIFDNYESIKKGEEVIIVGYPGVTAPQYGVTKSQDMFNNTTQVNTIPNPTVTVTSVSNIIRSDTKDQEKMVISEIGDVYQLSTGSTGPGNSGGPVFDMEGRAIGIYFAFKQGADLQYVVPIRFGKEMLE